MSRGGGAGMGLGLSPPLLEVGGANFENSLPLFVPQKYFAGPFFEP